MIEQATERREAVRQEVARDLQLALLALADELTGLAERIGSLDVPELAAVCDFVGATRHDLDDKLHRPSPTYVALVADDRSPGNPLCTPELASY